MAPRAGRVPRGGAPADLGRRRDVHARRARAARPTRAPGRAARRGLQLLARLPRPDLRAAGAVGPRRPGVLPRVARRGGQGGHDRAIAPGARDAERRHGGGSRGRSRRGLGQRSPARALRLRLRRRGGGGRGRGPDRRPRGASRPLGRPAAVDRARAGDGMPLRGLVPGDRRPRGHGGPGRGQDAVRAGTRRVSSASTGGRRSPSGWSSSGGRTREPAVLGARRTCSTSTRSIACCSSRWRAGSRRPSPRGGAVPAGTSVVLEGPFLLDARVQSRLDWTVHLEVGEEQRWRRLHGRDGRAGPADEGPEGARAVRQAHAERCDPRRLADQVLDASNPLGDGLDTPGAPQRVRTE